MNAFRVAPVGAFPTTYSGGNLISLPMVYPPSTFGGLAKTAASFPNGDWDFWWDGASTVALFNNQGVIAVTSSASTGGTNNRISFTSSGDSGNYGANLTVGVHAASGSGPWNYDFGRPRLLPAGSDPENFPKFRPNILARFAGMQSTRMLEPCGANSGNVTEFSDYMGDPSFLGLSNPVRSIRAQITSIADGSKVPGFTWTDQALKKGTPLLITAPGHGLKQDQYANIYNYTGGPITIRDSAGDTKTIDVNNSASTVYYVNDDQIVYYCVTFPGSDYRMVGTIANPGAGAIVAVDIQCDPLDDIIDWCNVTNTSMHFNTNFAATQDALTRVTGRIAARLNPGLKLRVEVSNETWNFSGPSPFAVAATGTAALLGGSPDDEVPYYCTKAKQHWGWMRDAWVAAGRDQADFIRVVGSLGAVTSKTAYRAGYFHSIGAAFEEVCIGAYLQNSPAAGPQYETDFYPVVTGMTVDQHLDKLEENFTYGNYESIVRGHHDAITGKQPDGTYLYPEYLGVKVIVYEGSPDQLALPGLSGTALGTMQHAIPRHPRWFPAYLHILRVYQDAGCALYHDYIHSHLDKAGGTNPPNGTAWSAYYFTDQPPYVQGDPKQDAIQINTPEAVDQLKSVTGGALLKWASMYKAGSPPPPPPPPPPVPTTTSRPKRLVPFRRPSPIR